MVVGSSSFVGNHIMMSLARKNPNLSVVGMSRSGMPLENETERFSNVSYVKNDALDPEWFRDHLEDVDGVIHCVGALIQKRKNPTPFIDLMSRETAINVATQL